MQFNLWCNKLLHQSILTSCIQCRLLQPVKLCKLFQHTYFMNIVNIFILFLFFLNINKLHSLIDDPRLFPVPIREASIDSASDIKQSTEMYRVRYTETTDDYRLLLQRSLRDLWRKNGSLDFWNFQYWFLSLPGFLSLFSHEVREPG